MTALERRYDLFSPAPGGGEKKVGETDAAISIGSLSERADGGVSFAVQNAAAIVRNERAPEAGFVRGMILRRGRESWRVCEARAHGRVWTLRLERSLMDGEA